MIAYIRKLSVVRNKWLDEESFKNGVSLRQAIPVATAMQMAEYADELFYVHDYGRC